MEFYEFLWDILMAMGWNRSKADSCIFWKLVDGELYIIAVHVDDLTLRGNLMSF